MKTKAQELAEGICSETEKDENGEEILRDLAGRVEPTEELELRVETLAEKEHIPKDRIWKAIHEIANERVAGWDSAEAQADDPDASVLKRFALIAEQQKERALHKADTTADSSEGIDTSSSERIAQVRKGLAEENMKNSRSK